MFDNTVRPETTSLYCRRALGKFVDVEHLLPTDLGRVEPGRYDAFVYIDDGLPYDAPSICVPVPGGRSTRILALTAAYAKPVNVTSSSPPNETVRSA